MNSSSADGGDLAQISISKSGFQFRATYLYLLPFKKPKWIEIDSEVTGKETSVMHLNRTMQSVMTDGQTSALSQGGKSTARRMRMGYEYTRVSQIFPISAIPPEWIFPASLLLHAYSEQRNEDMIILPNFPSETMLEQHKDKYYFELIPGKEYMTTLPHRAATIPNDSDKCAGLSEKDLTLLADGKLAHEGSKVGVWTHDDVSPASFLLSYRQANATMSWTAFATSYLVDFGG